MSSSRSRAGLAAVSREQGRGRLSLQGGLLTIPDSARSTGVVLIAGRGSGKSVLSGQYLAAQDCLRGVPQVILDGYGPTIDNFLVSLDEVREPARSEALSRVVYVDMSGESGRLMAWPLVQRDSRESLYGATAPYSEVVKRTDPSLASAPILGQNAHEEVWTNLGMLLAKLNWQVSEVPVLLKFPMEPALVQRLVRLAEEDSEVAGPVSYLTETLAGLRPAERESLLSTFKRKMAPFQHDPTLRAMMGASEPTLDWASVVEQGQTVLVDFRSVLDSDRRRFLMLWVLRSFLRFIKRRGAGRHAPIGLNIDELAALYHADTPAGQSVFAADLDEILNIWVRNAQIWIVLAFQETYQMDWRAQKTLLSMGTKLFGVTSDPEGARTIASILHPFDPALVKAFEPVYDGRGNLVDARPLYWSIEEQQELVAGELRRLKPFHFLMVRAGGEGDGAGRVLPLYVPARERGVWANQERVGPLRAMLAERTGVPREHLLAQIEARQAALLVTTRMNVQEDDTHARLEGDAHSQAQPDLPDDDPYAGFGDPVQSAA